MPWSCAPFWCAVLGYSELERDETGVSLGPPGGGGRPGMTLLRSTDPKVGTLRLHLDVNTTDGDQVSELARLLSVGARPVCASGWRSLTPKMPICTVGLPAWS